MVKDTIDLFLVPLDMYDSYRYGGGGVVIRSSDELQVYQGTFRLFQLSKGIEVNKNTRFQASLESQDTDISLCFFESIDDIENEYACQELHHLDDTTNSIDFHLGRTLNYKSTVLNYVAVKQLPTTGSSTIINDFMFVEDLGSDLFNENGECVDPNAERKMDEDGTAFCMCRLEYVSSNGGRMQGRFDQCVPCIMSESCSFEGEACTNGDDCDKGECIDNICETNVSYLYSLIFCSAYLC